MGCETSRQEDADLKNDKNENQSLRKNKKKAGKIIGRFSTNMRIS
jgi:hypothetical protein